MREFVVDLRQRLRGVWNADALAQQGEHTNKLAKYHHWMALPLRPLSVHGAPFSVPRSKLMRLIVLFPISWIFFVQLEQLSRPSSQATWLKVKPHLQRNLLTMGRVARRIIALPPSFQTCSCQASKKSVRSCKASSVKAQFPILGQQNFYLKNLLPLRTSNSFPLCTCLNHSRTAPSRYACKCQVPLHVVLETGLPDTAEDAPAAPFYFKG
eukprot:1156959-Pelagomonas_calceolata.AAC.1